MTVQYRPAESREEVLQSLEVTQQAFERTPGEYFRRRLDLDPTLEPGDTFLARLNNRIVGVVQRFPHQMYVRGKPIRLAGIGNVGTHPDFRGEGYASGLMRYVLQISLQQGFELAMLFTRIAPFFAGLGFRPVDRNEFYIQPVDEAPRGDVSRFSIENDLADVMALYEIFSPPRTGAVQRDAAYWRGQVEFARDDPDFFQVLRRQGRLLAYIRGCRAGNALRLMEYAYSDAFADMLQLASRVAHEFGFSRLRLPLTPEELFQAPNPVPIGDDEEDRIMLHVLNPEALTERFSLWDDDPDSILDHLFGPGEFTYWQTDFF